MARYGTPMNIEPRPDDKARKRRRNSRENARWTQKASDVKVINMETGEVSTQKKYTPAQVGKIIGKARGRRRNDT